MLLVNYFPSGFFKRIFFAWVVFLTFCSMVTMSILPMIGLRHYLLPEDKIDVPLDFVTRQVQSGSAEHFLQISQVNFADLPQMSREDYSITVILYLPRDEGNRDLHNFRVSGALSKIPWHKPSAKLHASDAHHFNADNIAYNSVERMASMPYCSSIIEWGRRVLLSPLYVVGLLEETSKLEVLLWDRAASPLQNQSYLLVSLPNSLWIRKATLKLTARMSGLRWVLYTFPVLSFCIGSWICFSVEVTGMMFVVLYFFTSGENSTRHEVSPYLQYHRLSGVAHYLGNAPHIADRTKRGVPESSNTSGDARIDDAAITMLEHERDSNTGNVADESNGSDDESDNNNNDDKRTAAAIAPRMSKKARKRARQRQQK